MPTPQTSRTATSARPGASPWYRRLWPPGRPWYRQPALYAVLAPGLALVLFGAFVAAYLFSAVPLPADIAPAATTVLDRDGQEVGALSGVAAREDVPLEEYPDHVAQAVMAAEDRGFYQHGGISLAATIRALFTNVRAGEVEQGGSTITQQYMKNAALTPERTFTRKAKEAVLALKMERAYAKDQILEFYLNTVYLGRGAYGMESAAKTYYARSAKDLTVNQAATLAGMIRSPERLDPDDQPHATDERRRLVLDAMVGEGWLERSEADRIGAEGLPPTTGRQSVDHGPAAYYMDALREELAAELGSEEAVYRGLTVHSEMDLEMQVAAQAILTRKVAEFNAEAGSGAPLSGAIVSVDPGDGGVRALVGGPDFGVQPFNAALAAPGRGAGNQPGSAFKPFGLAAFVAAGHHPDSVFPAPAEIEVDFEGYEPYRVRNFADAAYGNQTVHEATLTSTNTVYVQIAEEVGPDEVEELAVDAGIPDEWLDPHPSLILGGADVSALSMTEAFATFAAGGVHHEPRLVRRVEGADGEVLLDNAPRSEGAIDANVAYVVSGILKDNIEQGTGRRAQIGRPAAGKTGTTTDSLDGWFVGYVPQLATAVWLGNLDNQELGLELTGGGYPAATWGEYMAEATAGMEVEDFPEPDLSGLDRLNERAPSAGPSPRTSPTPSEKQCPDGRGGTLTAPIGEPCPSPTGPTRSPTPTPTPTPTRTRTPTPTPTTPTPTRTPAESETPTGPLPTGGGGGGGGGTADPSPSPSTASPSETEGSDPTPTPP
ncbi:MAG TPA: transglycosylase domain-containing protein [Nitriliruptorales bacterium]|nr:transglycosylase domain-containing protein [Nitriliruptorales bacterium]